MLDKYEVIIGLEVHAELATKTKIYCGCTTEFGGQPNTHCCPICTAQPGTLPVLNEKVVEFAVKTGLATNCEITRFSKQDRKNYYYPDLPKAYQTSQFDLPLCTNGNLEIDVNGVKKNIGITRIHIEEDAAKLIHDNPNGETVVDMNRCGVPLIEIVSEPDIRCAEEAKAYVEKLKTILEYIGVCDCKMQEGSLRCDVNLSVRLLGAPKFGTRTETKNLNSFKAIVKLIEFETKRQIDAIESGEEIFQETRRWDDTKGIGYAMRLKEEAHDYRYFSEPDLAPIILSDEYINNIKNNLPELSETKKYRYMKEFNLPEYDSRIISSSKKLAEFFEEVVKESGNPKAVANWILGDFLRIVNEKGLELDNIPFPANYLAKLIKLIDSLVISGAIAKTVFEEMFETGKEPQTIVDEKGLFQITNEVEIIKMVEEVLLQNPESIVDYKSGKNKAVGFIVGQTMKFSNGKANPQILNKIVLQELNKL